MGIETVLAAIGLGLGGTAAGGAFSKEPDIPEMPAAPKEEDTKAQAEATVKKRKIAASRSRSVYTSPLGIAGQAQITKRTLLGL